MEYIKIIVNTWQFNVIMVLIFSVIYNQSYKFAVTGIKKDGISTVLFEFIGGLSMLLLIPFFSFKSSFNYWLIFLFIFSKKREYAIFFFIYCTFVWFSLIYLGEHYVIDVIVGIIFATVVFYLVKMFAPFEKK